MCLSLSNGHARATVLSAVWSPADEQLVAVLMAATDKTVLTALKAELEKNNKNAGVALAGEAKADLRGAQLGYLHLSATLDKVNAQGHLTSLLHWRAHDPRSASARSAKGNSDERADDYFYVVAGPCADLPTVFLERLQLALAWPLQPAWAEELLHLGRENGLVENLPVVCSGALPPAAHSQTFRSAVRVLKADEAWGQVISTALAQHIIAF